MHEGRILILAAVPWAALAILSVTPAAALAWPAAALGCGLLGWSARGSVERNRTKEERP